MRLMIAAKEGTEILVDILNGAFSRVKIREICGQDEFVMPNGYTDFSRYAGVHKNDLIGEGKYKDMTYGDFLVKLGSFTGKGGYLDKLIRESMKPFTEGNDPGKRQGLFNRLYPGLMKYFRKDFDELFQDFDLNKPVMNTHYTTMMTDIAVIMNAIFGNHGRYLRDMNSAINRFVAGNLDLEQFRGELNSINDKMSDSGESNGTAVENEKEEAWKHLESSCRMTVPGVDPKYTWYKVDNHEDIWPVATAPATSWCVAQKGNSGYRFFNEVYRPPYYMMCEGHRPVVLLHVKSYQFKDAEDHPISLDRPSHVGLVEGGLRLLEKLNVKDYGDGHNDYDEDNNYIPCDFNVFKTYLKRGDDKLKDVGRISRKKPEDELCSFSDDEFEDWIRSPGSKESLDKMNYAILLPRLRKDRIKMLIGKSHMLDEELLASSSADEDIAMRIFAEESRRGGSLKRMFSLVMEKFSESFVLKILERFLSHELVEVVSSVELSHDINADNVARILLDGEDRIGRKNLLSVLFNWGFGSFSIIRSILRMSDDSEIIDAVSDDGVTLRLNDDDILWNIVKNGGSRSLKTVLDLCPETLSVEMTEHILRRYSKDRDVVKMVIDNVVLNRGMIETIADLGDKSLDRRLLSGQVMDDDLALRLIDELGDDYQGELVCNRDGEIHKYGSEVVDTALESALRNGNESEIISTQDLSEENVRKVFRMGKGFRMNELVRHQHLPKDLFDKLLSSGKYDFALAAGQPLDDSQVDRMFEKHGDKILERIAINDQITSGHAFDLVMDNLSSLDDYSYEMAESLMRKSNPADWNRVAYAIVDFYEQEPYDGKYFMLACIKECDDDDTVLFLMENLDPSYFREVYFLDDVLPEKINSKKVVDALLRLPLKEEYKDTLVYHLMNYIERLDPDQIHYIAEHLKEGSIELAEKSESIHLDDETVKLLVKWNNKHIDSKLLENGYFDRDTDDIVVEEIAEQRGFSFCGLDKVKNLGDGFIEYAVKHKDLNFARALCGNPFLSRSQVSRLLAIDPNDAVMKRKVAEGNENVENLCKFEGVDDPAIMMGLLNNKKIDESRLREICSSYRGKMVRSIADKMLERIGMISPIEKSDFLFDVIHNHPYNFSKEELVRLHGIGDEDVKWLCRKIYRGSFGLELPADESRTARIAGRICRRIVRMRRIAERISR